MTFQYASDLHLEFSQNTAYLKEHPLVVTGEILLLAGDISYLCDNRLNKHPFWGWVSDHYRQTYIVPGNHEYYGGYELAGTLDYFTEGIRSNVSYRNNQSVMEGDTEIFFSTLWAPVPQDKIWVVENGMVDCRRIIYHDKRFNGFHYTEVHSRCMEYLRNAIGQSKAEKKIVVTHHVPTELCNHEMYRNSQLSSAFVVELCDFIEDNHVDVWLYGHTHANMPEKQINKTRLLCNQLGYVKHGEHEWFDPSAHFELP